DVGEGALPGLRVNNVLHELLREPSGIKVVGPGPPEDAGIAHPSQALVALRTIGRNAQEISALAPYSNGPHAVHKIAGGSERPARVATDAADDFSFKGVERGRTRISRDLDVAKAVKRKVRSESLVAFAAKNVFVCGIGIAQIGRINRAVGIEDFSETQANSAARGSFHLQSRPTHHVLPHIKDIGSVWQVRDLLGPDSRDHPAGFGDLTGHG